MKDEQIQAALEIARNILKAPGSYFTPNEKVIAEALLAVWALLKGRKV